MHGHERGLKYRNTIIIREIFLAQLAEGVGYPNWHRPIPTLCRQSSLVWDPWKTQKTSANTPQQPARKYDIHVSGWEWHGGMPLLSFTESENGPAAGGLVHPTSSGRVIFAFCEWHTWVSISDQGDLGSWRMHQQRCMPPLSMIIWHHFHISVNNMNFIIQALTLYNLIL